MQASKSPLTVDTVVMMVSLTNHGLAEASVRRFRASPSSFFAWAVRERLILTNPVPRTRVPG